MRCNNLKNFTLALKPLHIGENEILVFLLIPASFLTMFAYPKSIDWPVRERTPVHFNGIMGLAQWASACMSLGIARSAFDIALEYTKERKSGGMQVTKYRVVRRYYELIKAGMEANNEN